MVFLLHLPSLLRCEPLFEGKNGFKTQEDCVSTWGGSPLLNLCVVTNLLRIVNLHYCVVFLVRQGPLGRGAGHPSKIPGTSRGQRLFSLGFRGRDSRERLVEGGNEVFDPHARSWPVLSQGPSGDRIARSCRHTGPDLTVRIRVKDRIAKLLSPHMFWVAWALF